MGAFGVLYDVLGDYESFVKSLLNIRDDRVKLKEGAPYCWDPERRAVLQAEIDRAIFHAYGHDRDQTGHIFSTFRALRDSHPW